MSIGRAGGWLFTGGLALFVVAVAILIARGTIDVGHDLDPLIGASLGLVSFGAIVLALAGPPPLRGRLVGLGLGSLATGSLTLALAVLASGSLRGSEVDFLILPLVGGAGAVAVGALAIGLALARLRGVWEWPGLVLLAGMGLVLLGTWGATADLLGAMAQAVTAAGWLIVFLGALGMGLLATLTSERSLDLGESPE